MQNAHTQNLQQTEALSHRLDLQPMKGSMALRLQRNGEMEANSLRHTSRNRFDQAYVRDMVKGHRAALHLLAELNAMATHPLLKDQLRATQSHVQAHLNDAIALENHYH
jgi:putative membrane protein